MIEVTTGEGWPTACTGCGRPTFHDPAEEHITAVDRERGCERIESMVPLPDEKLAAVLIAYGWAEIISDLDDPRAAWPTAVERAGYVPTPEDIGSFGDLHDWCDANTYALLCDDELYERAVTSEAEWERWVDLGRVVQDSLDLRIIRGDHLGERA